MFIWGRRSRDRRDHASLLVKGAQTSETPTKTYKKIDQRERRGGRCGRVGGHPLEPLGDREQPVHCLDVPVPSMS